MSTPNATTINAVSSDGTTTDVTEAVQVLYDLVVQSMDWGSGFLSIEDVVPVYRLAELCGFGESPKEYLIGQQVLEEERRWESTQPHRVRIYGSPEADALNKQLAQMREQWRTEAEAKLRVVAG